MTEDKKQLQEETVACEICLKEIPISEALNAEATDYVFHFCGTDCYAKWKEKGEKHRK